MRVVMLGVLLSGFSVLGCGPDIQKTCEEQIKCQGGNDRDVDACVAVSEVAIDLYDDIGCGDEYDDYMACIEPLAECKSTQTGQTCANDSDCGGGGDQTCSNGNCVASYYGVSAEDEDKCETESLAYAKCAKF